MGALRAAPAPSAECSGFWASLKRGSATPSCSSPGYGRSLRSPSGGSSRGRLQPGRLLLFNQMAEDGSSKAQLGLSPPPRAFDSNLVCAGKKRQFFKGVIFNSGAGDDGALQCLRAHDGLSPYRQRHAPHPVAAPREKNPVLWCLRKTRVSAHAEEKTAGFCKCPYV